MDPTAYNYNPNANVDDNHCHYDAGCITGPGNPYWLNDPCYAWVIDVDEYCCNNTWDNSCQELYNYCDYGWPTNIEDINNKLIVYPNPTKDMVYFTNFVDISIYNTIGQKIIEDRNVRRVDMSKFKNGMYTVIINYRNKYINHIIIKE